MRSIRSSLFIFVLAAAGFALPVSAATLSPYKDAFLRANGSTSNYGGAGALEISGSGTSKGEFQSVLAFNFGTIKTTFDSTYGAGGWAIDTLSLQLSAASANNALFNANAAGIIAARWFDDDSWVEGTGTPMSSQPVAGVNYDSLAGLLVAGEGSQAAGSQIYGGADGEVISFALSSAGLFTDVYAGSTASLNLFAGSTTTSGLFNSRTGANPPVLTITAVAIPEASTGLLAIAAFVVSTLRRRR